MTLKNAAGLTLVGTFCDASTQARRCYKPFQALSRVYQSTTVVVCAGELGRYGVQYCRTSCDCCLTVSCTKPSVAFLLL